MSRPPTFLNKLSKQMQTKINSYIPEKIHKGITVAIKQMIRGVLFGATSFTAEPGSPFSLREAEEAVNKKIISYRHAAAAEGGIIGSGGILLGFAELPILLGIKIKLLFDIASLYGYSVKDYKERLFLLYIFQLAYSSQQHRREVFAQMVDWKSKSEALPDDIHQFNWRIFQQEYRDYIDLAKMAQLIPGIGAVVGFVVNASLINKLGHTAMNAYRMRWLDERGKLA